MREAAKVGARLAREGVVGRFALDFVAVRDKDGTWDAYAIEINLRKGGTTHPFLTLQFLTDGVMTPTKVSSRQPLANRNVLSPATIRNRRCTGPSRPMTYSISRRVTACTSTTTQQTGIVFHMMSALAGAGRFGLTAVADTHAEADALHAKTVAAIAAEANRLMAAGRA